jgi:hypothetical protein
VPDFKRLHGNTEPGDTLLDHLHVARNVAVENNLSAMDKQKKYFDRSATHHVYHEGQFVLVEDFNFLNKNCELAPCFSGPFHILPIKEPNNMELLLTNGCKIIVNIPQVKPYLSSAPSLPSNCVNVFLH